MEDAEDDELEIGPRTPSPTPVPLPPTPPEIARSREHMENANMRYQDVLSRRLAVANEKASEAQAVEKYKMLREHEALETKTKDEEHERIYKRTAVDNRRQKKAKALAKKRGEDEQASREQQIRSTQRLQK